MLPAFGRELLDLRRSGKRPAKPVYVVGDWTLAKEFRRRDRFALMVELPAERGVRNAPRFDFSMLQDLEVVCVPDSFEWMAAIPPQIAIKVSIEATTRGRARAA